ncbi:glycosyltransferase [Microbacterium xanthum]|uniref:glycosyltransferase n=1 Tax=Microbacterium xanthum TaxID=3079794 RepID=UPI002AD588B5|nr:glycosyltransferase [Microbacterium sp. KSW-48]MDZ8170735.1 glycosyltransferase [Microbacterium sp. KSW-48]
MVITMSRTAPTVTVLGLNYPPEPTGIAPYTGAIARGLSQRGYKTHVVTTHPHYPEWRVKPGYGQWSRREHLDGVSLRRLRHYVPTRPTGVRRLLSEVSFGARLLFERWQRPRAVVAVSPALFSSSLAAARMRLLHRGTPLVVWVQDLYWLGLSETGQSAGRAGQVIKKTEGWLLRRADRVVVIHERFAQRVINDFSVPPDKVVVVRNWTHLPPAPDIDRAAARARLGWGEEAVVLHAGNMGIKQGLDNVLDAAQLAHDRGANVRFVLLGNGAEHARLVAEGAHIPNLQFIDPLPDAEFAEALGAADILLVNEKVGVSEMAVPSKLTSYFSTGNPVLAATDMRGITADEVRAADGGVVVKAGDPSALLDAAVKLASDPEESVRLGANGRRYRETVLDETFAIDQFATLLSRLIDGDGSK